MKQDSGFATIKTYVALTKPGIIRGNLMTAAAAFLLASKGDIKLSLLVWTLAGIALVIASGCVFNNYIDREIDRKMARTKERALVTGKVKAANAIAYAVVLGMAGFAVLALRVNLLTLLLGALALFFYVVVYGFAKRRSVHGTLVGSIPGAMSLLAGYTAVTGRVDLEALLLFIILAVWQMPHFYAIAMYRKKDYASAGLPVLPVVKGMAATKLQILVYIVLFAVAALSLRLFGYTGNIYLVVMVLISVVWLRMAIKGFTAKDDAKWGRKLFGFSLIVLLVFSLMISLESLLP